MKRYTSAILVPCLLMQLYGCYSTKYLSTEELHQYYLHSPITVTTNDGRELIIKKYVTIDEVENDSGSTFCTDFHWLDDNLILSKVVGLNIQKDYNGNQIKLIKTETLSLSKEMISEIFVSEYNLSATLILSGIVGIAIILGIIYLSHPKFHFNLK